MPEESVTPEGGTSQKADISASPESPASGNYSMNPGGDISGSDIRVHPVCPACSSQNITELFDVKDHLVSGSDFLIRRCKACGMGWTTDPPPESEAGSYYASEEYISHTDKKQSISDCLYHLARGFMLGRKYNLVTKAAGKRTGTLLDIGSGTGYFAAFMQKRGWEVTGIEINDDARSYSIEKSGINAKPPGEVKKVPSGSADCITFWHVLEHLYDMAGWLEEVKRILSSDGKCIIALPNFSSADARWFGNRWAALDVPRHLWHFTPAAMSHFVSKQGFTVEKKTALPLDLFYISVLSYKNLGSPFPLLRGLLTGGFLAIRSGFRKEKASSLVYILSKKV